MVLYVAMRSIWYKNFYHVLQKEDLAAVFLEGYQVIDPTYL